MCRATNSATMRCPFLVLMVFSVVFHIDLGTHERDVHEDNATIRKLHHVFYWLFSS